jgi:hypothetical protein
MKPLCERIRHLDHFEAPSFPGEMAVTINFEEIDFGTELTIVQPGIPDAMPY